MLASYAYGEQVGGTPESGSTSYIKTLYTDLQTSGFGSDVATPDWGAYWNRLKTSAQWVPSGTVTASDIAIGKTFYNSSRVQQTGTSANVAPINCASQLYHDGYGAPATQTTNCTNTVIWTVPSDNIVGSEKQDPRSGLIWSNGLQNKAGVLTFSPATISSWSWGATSSNNVAVGNKTAVSLCTSMGNGWRLPSQKELLQAYIDGAFYNITNTDNAFYSSTPFSSTSAWYAYLSWGAASYATNNSPNYVRCVR